MAVQGYIIWPYIYSALRRKVDPLAEVQNDMDLNPKSLRMKQFAYYAMRDAAKYLTSLQGPK